MLFHIAGKGYLRGLIEAVYIHFHYFTPAPYHNIFVVWHPGKAGIYPEYCPCFLLVFRQFIVHRPFLSGFQITQEEYGLCADPPHKSHQFSIVRYLRAYRAAWPAGNYLTRPFFPVKAFDNEYLVVRILIILEETAGVHILTIIYIMSVGRNTGFVQVLLVIFSCS